ncbi:MAG: DUF2232 domain-containing protein [Gammaproteobacteria bacterium]|nr:DUF2232 domain-containing protein [Gammaproteobacteria bacterium]MCP5201203.1 DUF2232 domain-containing protein [Gammaproteobacteria bacterium]
MRFLARFAMRGPFQAAAVAAATLLGALSFGVLIVFSGATVGLTALRQGSREGLKIMALATSLVVAVRIGLGLPAVPVMVLGLIVWLPAWLMALNLARTRHQALPLMMIAALVTAYAVVMRVGVGDVDAFWATRLQALFDALAAEGGPRLGAEQVAIIARQVHHWTLVAMFSLYAATILLARWWQAVLYNPGGFGAEFRELRLPRLLLPVAALSGAGMLARLSGVEALGIAGDCFVIVVVLFAFQGLAVIHHRARVVTLARGWLVGLYVLLALTPQIVGPVLATAGVADCVSDFRRLSARRGREDGEA